MSLNYLSNTPHVRSKNIVIPTKHIRSRDSKPGVYLLILLLILRTRPTTLLWIFWDFITYILSILLKEIHWKTWPIRWNSSYMIGRSKFDNDINIIKNSYSLVKVSRFVHLLPPMFLKTVLTLYIFFFILILLCILLLLCNIRK